MPPNRKSDPSRRDKSDGDPEEALNPDDNRMQQVYHAGGQLFSAITSTIYRRHRVRRRS